MSFRLACLLTALGLFVNSAPCAAEFPEYAHPVMTWVPPYGVAKAQARLKESFGGVGMPDALTHLALQFWAPTKSGGVERVRKYGELSDATITALRDWGHAHGIRVLLCVFNGVEKWDWPLARGAFADHTVAFAEALVAEAKRLDLDGVDVDLEGNGEFDADKDAFVRFVRELSTRAHAADMHVTVDSFADVWNAPSKSWWKDLFPHVDALTSMGYEETGAKGAGWRAYSAQKTAAGENAAKFLLGLPASKNEWQHGKAIEQLRAARDSGVGVALWDAQLEASAWRTREVWSTLREIRGPR